MKPRYKDHCGHALEAFGGKVLLDGKSSDIYFYRDTQTGQWWYCARRSDEPSDYHSGPLRPNQAIFAQAMTGDDIAAAYNSRMAILAAWWEFTQQDPAPVRRRA